MANENSATGSRKATERDRSYGGGYGANGGSVGGGAGLAAERQRLRAMGATTVTPKYGWDQAHISDFGITGGLMNMAKGILAGDTYNGRTPQGLRGGFGSDGGQKWTPQQQLLARAGLYGGGTNYTKAMRPAGLSRAPQASSPAMGLQYKPQTYQPASISIPGGSDYGVTFDPWKYFT